MGAVQQKKKRQEWLDAARTLGITLVVLCHSVEVYDRPVLSGQKRVGMLTWLAENFMLFAGRVGVPLFLCISGALLFYRDILFPIVVYAYDYRSICGASFSSKRAKCNRTILSVLT